MKKSKRILALVLVLALAFTSFAMFASASEAEDPLLRRASCPLCGSSLRITYPKSTSTETVLCSRIPNRAHLHLITIYNEEQDCSSSSCPYYSFYKIKSTNECLG